jgi:hypothetical protein
VNTVLNRFAGMRLGARELAAMALLKEPEKRKPQPKSHWLKQRRNRRQRMAAISRRQNRG